MWLKAIRNGTAMVMLAIASAVKPALAADSTFDVTPDSPQGFGFKGSWFAVKCQDPKHVAKTLGFNGLQQANWASGISAAYVFDSKPNGKMMIFISPPVRGWVLVFGREIPYPDKRAQGRNVEIDERFEAMFGALAAKYDEVQFFGSYRVVGFEAWARAKAGKIDRVFSYADGEVYENFGSQTVVEKQLKFPNLSGMTPEAATSAIFSMTDKREAEEQMLIASGLPPKEARGKMAQRQRQPIPTEGDAMAIAGHWSIDPTRIEELKLPPSVGYIAVLPNRMGQ